MSHQKRTRIVKIARRSRQGPAAEPDAELPPDEFPIKINFAEVLNLAAAADAAEQHSVPQAPISPRPAKDQTSAPENEFDRMKVELLAALPELIRKEVAAAREPGPSDPDVQEKLALDSFRTWLQNQLSEFESRAEQLTDNRKLADELIVRAAQAGHLFKCERGGAFRALAEEIGRFVYEIAEKAGGRETRQAVGETSLGATPASQGKLDPRVFSGGGATLPATKQVENFDGEITANGPPITPKIARDRSSAVKDFKLRFDRVCGRYPNFADAFQLRWFAGRTHDEIAELTGGQAHQTQRQLVKFIQQIDRQKTKVSR